jgi:hypothetical protein
MGALHLRGRWGALSYDRHGGEVRLWLRALGHSLWLDTQRSKLDVLGHNLLGGGWLAPRPLRGLAGRYLEVMPTDGLDPVQAKAYDRLAVYLEAQAERKLFKGFRDALAGSFGTWFMVLLLLATYGLCLVLLARGMHHGGLAMLRKPTLATLAPPVLEAGFLAGACGAYPPWPGPPRGSGPSLRCSRICPST